MRWIQHAGRGAAALTITASALFFTGCKDDPTDTPPGGGGLQIAGLTADVHVDVDADGVPHIQCATATDCAAALGYLHARDRFVQMEIRRSFVRGRLHRIVNNPLVVDVDQQNRTTYLTRDARPIEEAAMDHVSPETKALLDAYTIGVNTWLNEARQEDGPKFSDEFYFSLINRAGIADWTAEDSLASVVALVDSLTNSSSDELALAARALNVDPDLFQDLMMPRPVSDATTLFGGYIKGGDTGATPNNSAQLQRLGRHADVLNRALDMRKIQDAILGREGDRGSNNWVVGPSRSASGNALLSDDPHLGHTNPATWYIVEMRADDGSMHVAGVSFAGLPWVILGQNENLAWGATTTYFDQADVYLEELSADGTKVKFNGEEVAMLTYDTSLTIKDKVYPGTAYVVPHHGPVLSMDTDAGTAVSLRWTGADLSTDVNYLTTLSRAKTVEEGREAARLITTLGQNWVMIDTKGSFGWFPYNRLPIRAGVDENTLPLFPLPGQGGFEWTSYMDLDDLPQLMNNPEGYIATANNDMTGALYDGNALNDDIPLFQSSAADGLRQERILDLLGASSTHTIETMRDVVGDTYMLLADYVVPSVKAFLEDDMAPEFDAARSMIAGLETWNGTCPTGLATSDSTGAISSDAADVAASKQCLIFHRFVVDLREGIFGDELRAAYGTTKTPRGELAALTDILRESGRILTDDYWDNIETPGTDETPQQIIAAAAATTTQWITDKLGADEANWQWGRVHRVTLLADLFSTFGLSNFDNGAYALPGGLSTVNVASPSQNPADGFDVRAGASMRLICEGFPAGMDCSIQMPGGQRHYRESPYYQNFLERWLTNTPAPLRFGIEIANPIEQLTFKK